MLLGPACRIWRLGIVEHCQPVHLCQAHRLSEPFATSLTPYTFAYTVGRCQCNFGHYPCRWLASCDEMQHGQLKPSYPASVQGQQFKL